MGEGQVKFVWCVCYALIVFAYVKVFAKTHTNADYWKGHQKASARSGLECAASVSTFFKIKIV